MKAAVIRSFGEPEVLQLEEVETPRAAPGHIIVKVLAALVNRLDHYIRSGEITQNLAFPHILGMDAVGEVSEIGEGCKRFKIGDRVIAMPGYPRDPAHYKIRPATTAPSYAMRGLQLTGSYAQYISIPEEWVLLDTTGLSVEQAASLPVPFLTSLRAVQIAGEVKKGHKVLVHAGGSATGIMSIQIARALGAKVATTVRSEESGQLAKWAGAELIINTRTENFNEKISDWTDGQGVETAIDSLGGASFENTINAVKTNGIIVAMGFMSGPEVKFNIRDFFFSQKQIRGALTADIEDLQDWLTRIKNGDIKAIVDCALPLEEAAEAHRKVANNTAKGAVILLPWN